MDEDTLEQLGILIDEEQIIRNEWRKAIRTLETLVNKASKHNRTCCEFWNKHLSDTEKIVTNFNDDTLLIKKPKLENASSEAYLPYGIDYESVKRIDITEQ